MNEKIREIRRKLYLNRDGASSSSMKEKGIHYKMNLGVPVHKLKKIAAPYFPNDELAKKLWKEEIRELKIVATLIADPTTFSESEEWVNAIQNLELAEQVSIHLLSKQSQAGKWASKWMLSDQPYIRLIGFLVYIRLFMNNYRLEDQEYTDYFHAVYHAIGSDFLPLKNAAVNSLKYLGRQSAISAKNILADCQKTTFIPENVKNELLETLHFEFDYYA